MENKVDIIISSLLNDENRKEIGNIIEYRIAKWVLINSNYKIMIFHDDELIGSIQTNSENIIIDLKKIMNNYLNK